MPGCLDCDVEEAGKGRLDEELLGLFVGKTAAAGPYAGGLVGVVRLALFLVSAIGLVGCVLTYRTGQSVHRVAQRTGEAHLFFEG